MEYSSAVWGLSATYSLPVLISCLSHYIEKVRMHITDIDKVLCRPTNPQEGWECTQGPFYLLLIFKGYFLQDRNNENELLSSFWSFRAYRKTNKQLYALQSWQKDIQRRSLVRNSPLLSVFYLLMDNLRSYLTHTS